MSEAGKPASSSNEPFVPRSDRPELNPDARLADLTVRDLLGVLERGAGSPKTLVEKPAFAETNFKVIQFSKYEYLKQEMWKMEHWKLEHLKVELWKIEHPDIPVPTLPPGPDPRFTEIAQQIAGLREQVHTLSSEVAELRRHGQR